MPQARSKRHPPALGASNGSENVVLKQVILSRNTGWIGDMYYYLGSLSFRMNSKGKNTCVLMSRYMERVTSRNSVLGTIEGSYERDSRVHSDGRRRTPSRVI
ncbi:hypothetical protein AFLA_007827 [Aspergillus flavus NRRL3357]|nr:hypothetical protein AFLA_007827 [Aspergillus flavus NRRL3357]